MLNFVSAFIAVQTAVIAAFSKSWVFYDDLFPRSIGENVIGSVSLVRCYVSTQYRARGKLRPTGWFLDYLSRAVFGDEFLARKIDIQVYVVQMEAHL